MTKINIETSQLILCDDKEMIKEFFDKLRVAYSSDCTSGEFTLSNGVEVKWEFLECDL